MAGNRVVLVLIGCCLVVSLVAPVAGATTPGESGYKTPAVEPQSISVITDRTYQTESTNNSTRHTDPTVTDEDGDIRRVKGYLARRMGVILTDCTEGARTRNFSGCNLNESYPDQLSKYANVTGQQDDSNENNAVEAFEVAENDLRSFNNQAELLSKKSAELREARDNENTTRTRQLARQLLDTASQINRTAESLNETYDQLSNQTDVDTTEARENIDIVQLNVRNAAAALTDRLFIQTQLTVETSDQNASFRDPLTLTGRLAMSNGTAIANRSIRLQVENQTIRTRTNETGRFRLEYRPTTLPLDTNTITAQYRPRTDSVFLPANDTAPITLTQATPTVTVAANQSTARFTTPLSLAGSVTAGDVQARGVPVALSVGNRRVATVQTNSTGRYQTRFRLPASVVNGSRTVQARLALDRQALAPANGTTPLRVQTTPTNLTASVAQTNAQQVRVQGTLATDDEISLADQRVAIRAGDDNTTVVQTNATGSYTAQIQLPEDVTTSATLTVTSEFTGTGTNLQPSRALTSFTITPSESELLDWIVGFLLMRWPFISLLAGLVALGAGGFWAAGRESPTEETNGDDEHITETDDPQRATVSESEPETESSQPSPMDRARARIATGEVDEAVISVYAMTRTRLAVRLGLEGGETHWEVVDRYRKTIDADAVSIGSFSVDSALFEQLTQAYERAAFAPSSVSRDSAETLLTDLTESDDDRSTDTQPGD